MKPYLSFFAIVLALLGCLSLASCNKGNDPSETTKNPNEVTVTFNVGGRSESITVEKGTPVSYAGSTIKPSDDTSTYRFTGWDKEFAPATEDVTYTALYDVVPLVEYQVRWILQNGVITTTVKENDTPVPPSYDTVVETNTNVYTFTGWSIELQPLTLDFASTPSNLIINALYDTARRTYAVKFMLDGAEYATTETYYEELPVLPETTPTKAGYHSFFWSNSKTPVTTTDVVCTGYFAHTDAEQLAWALTDETDFGYPAAETTWDQDPPVQTAGNALLYLLYELRQSTSDHPNYTDIYSRIVEQLKYMVGPTNNAAPLFDLRANWPYCTITAAILLAKETPVVWDALTADEKERYDFIMECFAYILALGTDDDNDYKTGPQLKGNYYKNWNPNYRLATCLPMIFVGRYFGGAAAVDEMLLSFDFDTVTDKFLEYGFYRSYNAWMTTPAQKPDGTYYPSAKDFMMNGGDAHVNVTNDRLGYVPGTQAGTGVGVRTTYTYKGYTVDQPDKIIESIFAYNYEGGEVKSSYGVGADGQPLAYIVGYLTSPYEGEPGLMKEFAGTDANGIRSSTDYCSHDFIMVVNSLLVTTELDMYDPLADENIALFRLVWVGNQDFVFKFEKGYMSYSLGESKGVSQESTERGYMLMKSFWLIKYGNMQLSDFPAVSGANNSLIAKEDYTNTTVDVNGNETLINDFKYYANGKVGVTMNTVTQNDNTFLKISSPANGNDCSFNLEPKGGLAEHISTKYPSFTFSIDLAKIDGVASFSSNCRMRGSQGSKDTASIFCTWQDGSVYLGADELKIGTLTTEFQTFTFNVNFVTGKISASVNGTSVGSINFKTPNSTAHLDWAETLTSYVFNWWLQSPSGTDRTILIDNIMISLDVNENDNEDSDRYLVDGADVYRVTDASHWEEKKGASFADILKGDHFYPTESNPNGKSLFIEFSFLYNETLANLDYKGLAFGRIGGLSPYYIALASNFYDLWCKTAGGFESTSGTTVLEGPACNRANGQYPSIGEYGWHRIGIEIHQDAAIVSGKVEYTLYATLYVDGESVSKIMVSHNTITSGKPGTDYLLYTATISGNTLVYQDNEDASTEVYAYRCEGAKTKGTNVAYIVTKDMSITCGTDFVVAVTKATSPESATIEVDPGTTLDATTYFTSVTPSN